MESFYLAFLWLRIWWLLYLDTCIIYYFDMNKDYPDDRSQEGSGDMQINTPEPILTERQQYWMDGIQEEIHSLFRAVMEQTEETFGSAWIGWLSGIPLRRLQNFNSAATNIRLRTLQNIETIFPHITAEQQTHMREIEEYFIPIFIERIRQLSDYFDGQLMLLSILSLRYLTPEQQKELADIQLKYDLQAMEDSRLQESLEHARKCWREEWGDIIQNEHFLPKTR